ncbi:hypothetical protein GGS20DRAFT_353974 [Poronia punctata]|nr:hypothetical protein GGS20DRAFT_353974 [Poronia punctata]
MLDAPTSDRSPASISLEAQEETKRSPPLRAESPTSDDGREPHLTLTYDADETIHTEPISLSVTDPAEKSSPYPTFTHHQRQRSVPTFSAGHLTPPPHSTPRRSPRQFSQGMPLTGDGRRGNSPGRFGGWLGRPSTPPGDGEENNTPSSDSIRSQGESTPKTAAQSRLSFLASSMSAFTRMTSPTPQTPARPVDDELCDLDIEAALFPGSGSSPQDSSDTFSPAAYKNLQANATGLLRRMQDACRQRTMALREMQAEKEALKEEMEETGLRARNFKSQLEMMATKAAENEEAMEQLVAELHAEKRARHEERAAHEKMFRAAAAAAAAADPDHEEDLCVDEDERKRWRKSNGTLKSELSIDTDVDVDSTESETISIFSRSRSPTAMTSITENESVETSSKMSTPTAKPRPAPQQQQLTTFQRLVKGVAATNKEELQGADGCRNCKGQNASVAWNTVSLLRDENITLKQRVAQLDVIIDGALDIVNGIKV